MTDKEKIVQLEKELEAYKNPTQHAGDCMIYASVHDTDPLQGICTCGYGWHCVRNGDWSEMFSEEYLERIAKSEK